MGSMAVAATKALAIAGAAFTGFGIKSAAEMAVVEAQFDQTFKGIEKEGSAMLEQLSSDFNILPERLKPAMSSFQGYFKGAEMTATEAMEATNKAMILASDGAAYFDRSLEDTSGSLKSFLMGNFEAGDAIGINTNKTKIATAYNKDYGGSFDELTEAQKQNYLLEYVEGVYKLNGAMGQGIRESQEWGNVTGNLASAFGTLAGTVMQPFLEPLNIGMQILTDKMVEATGKIREFYESLSENEAITLFRAAIEEAFNGDFSSLIGIGRKLLNNIITGLTETLPNLRVKALEIVTTLTTSIMENLPQIIETGFMVITTLINSFFEKYPALLLAAGQLILIIVQGILENLPQIIQSGIVLIDNLVQGIIQNLPKITQSVLTIVTEFLNTLITNLPAILEAGINLLFKLVDGITEALPAIGQSALTIISTLLGYITENLPRIVAMGVQMLTKLVRGIADRLPEITAVVMDIITEFISVVVDHLPDIIAAGVDIILSLIEGIIDMFGDIEGATNDVVDIITDTIADIDLFEIGANIIRGLWRGMGSLKDWIGGKIGGFVDNVTGFFTGGFKIKSPSRLMEQEVGVFITQGIGEGIERDKGKLKNAINSVIGYGVSGVKIPPLSPFADDVFGKIKKPEDRLDWASPMVKSSKKTKEAAEYFMYLLGLITDEVVA